MTLKQMFAAPLPPEHPRWHRAPRGAAPVHALWCLVLLPLLLVWTLPQTLAGLGHALALGLVRRRRPFVYRFGWFAFLVVPARPLASRGISLGLVVVAEDPGLLVHEFCHLYTGLWLGWLYLPVYGLEYLVVGHARSPHERLTCRFEARTRLSWRRVW